MYISLVPFLAIARRMNSRATHTKSAFADSPPPNPPQGGFRLRSPRLQSPGAHNRSGTLMYDDEPQGRGEYRSPFLNSWWEMGSGVRRGITLRICHDRRYHYSTS